MKLNILTNYAKEYPDMIHIVIYKSPQVYLSDDFHVKRSKYEVDDSYRPSVTSISRTKALVRDIVLCNDFDYFCTFTFDPAKVNRYSLPACWGKMSRWIHHQKEKSPDLAYLIIPEYHKDGAIHFHALIKHFNGVLSDSKHISSTGLPVYNITSFRSGFSTAVEIDDREGVANYVTKYITKDFIKEFNQRRFFCSRNLVRPKKTTNSDLFDKILPLFRRRVAEYSDREVYYIDKNNLTM